VLVVRSMPLIAQAAHLIYIFRGTPVNLIAMWAIIHLEVYVSHVLVIAQLVLVMSHALPVQIAHICISLLVWLSVRLVDRLSISVECAPPAQMCTARNVIAITIVHNATSQDCWCKGHARLAVLLIMCSMAMEQLVFIHLVVREEEGP